VPQAQSGSGGLVGRRRRSQRKASPESRHTEQLYSSRAHLFVWVKDREGFHEKKIERIQCNHRFCVTTVQPN
jgi:hypothetical protein